MIKLTVFEKFPSHFWVAIAGWISRIFIAAVQVLSIPLLFKLLGLENYAAFSIVIGLSIWFSLADLGLGTSLQNYISVCRSKNEDFSVLLQNIFPLIFFAGLGILLFFAVAAWFFQPFIFRGIDADFRPFVFGLGGCLYLLMFIFSVGYKILFSLQRGYIVYLYQTLGSGIGFLLLLFMFFWHQQVSVELAFFMWIFPQVFFAGLAFFQHIPISFKGKFDWAKYGNLLLQAKDFFLWVLLANLALACDYFLIGHFLSSSDVVAYSTIMRVYVFINFGYSSVLTALWPVFAEKFAENSYKSRKAVARHLKANILMGTFYLIAATLVFILARGLILEILHLKSAIVLPATLILLIGCYFTLRVEIDAYAVALVSRGRVRECNYVSLILAVLNIPLMIILIRHFGLYGLVSALIISCLLTAAWMLPWLHYRLS